MANSAPPASTPPNAGEKDNRVAICGYSVHLPGGITTGEQLVELIRNKVQCKRDFVAGGRFDGSLVDEMESGNPWKFKSKYCNLFDDEELGSYDCHFFRVTQKLAKFMDFRQVAILQAVWEALEHAGITSRELYRTRTGVFVGAYAGYQPSQEAVDETTLRGSLMSSLADHVSFFLGTHGPSLTIETACSSSLVALAMAVASLRKGDCDYAIVATTNCPESKDFHLSLQACGVLSLTGTSHPFDEAGPKGYVRGEGHGAVVLRRMPDALAANQRVLCTILNAVAGSAGAAEGALEGAGRMYESPCAYGMKQLMSQAYHTEGISPSRVQYMEFHATGTTVGDLIELNAVADILGGENREESGDLRVASIKSNIGHAEVAAGMFSLIKVIEMLRRRVFLPTAGVTCPRSDFDWRGNRMAVIQEEEPFPEDVNVVMGVNSFGIGGSYAHVVVEEYRNPPSARKVDSKYDGLYLLPLSAVSEQHFQLYAKNLEQSLSDPKVLLRDACGTIAVHRSRMNYRKAITARTKSELREKLQQFAEGGANPSSISSSVGQRTLFVFTGQGAQWVGCGESLMACPAYRDAVLQVDSMFTALAGWSVLEKSKTLTVEQLRDTMYAQPVTFMIQVGLFHLLKQLGIFPAMVTGHSAGEVSAAYAAGLMNLDEAVRVVYHRSQEQQKLAGSGRLLAVGLGLNAAKEVIGEKLKEVEVACVNSPQSIVLAGSEDTLAAIKASLPTGTFASFVPGNIAFHSSRVEPILPAVAKLLSFLDGDNRPEGDCPFISTVTGQVTTKVDAHYWCENVRRAVLFEEAISTAFSDEEYLPDLVIEVGPHKTLAGPVMQIIQSLGVEAPPVYPTLKRGEECSSVMVELMGELFEKDTVSLDFGAWYYSLGMKFLELPRHPFINKRMNELIPLTEDDKWNGRYQVGPVAGAQVGGKEGLHRVEFSDRTFKQMMDHKMGGQEIAPGTLYVEMVLEATGLPCTLTNVEFKSMCKIPHVSSGGVPTLLTLGLKEDTQPNTVGHAKSFAVRSTPAKVRPEELSKVPITEHCTGYIIKTDLLDENGNLRGSRERPEAFGLLGHCELKDIGREGLKALIARHATPVAISKEQFYGIVNQEGLAEYGPSFQVLQSVHADLPSSTYVGRYLYDSETWTKQGGCYGIQLLDGFYQMPLCLPSHDPQVVTYAGGFESAHFIRRPATNEVYGLFREIPNAPYNGRRKTGGSFEVYDTEGRLILYIKNIFFVFGASTNTTRLCDVAWQPRLTSSDDTFINEGPNLGKVEALADLIRSTIVNKQATSGSRTVFRVLEVIEEASEGALMVEALSRLDVGQDIIVEVFVGSHNGSLLKTAASSVSRHATWLRVRKLLLPSMKFDLADVCFDATIIHGWSSAADLPWQNKGPTSNSIQNAVLSLSTFSTPGAQLFVLGIDKDVEDRWVEELKPYGTAKSFPQQSLVVARISKGSFQIQPQEGTPVVVVVGGQDSAGTLLAKALESNGVKVRSLTCGPKGADLVDKAGKAEWADIMGPLLTDIKAQSQVLSGVVYAAGFEDTSVLGTQAFDRLIKLSQAILPHSQAVKDVKPVEHDPFMWVLTLNAFEGDIKPNQGTIQGLGQVLCHELPDLVARLVDMDSLDDLPQVAELVCNPPRENNYRTGKKGIQVVRLFPLDIESERSMLVSPESTEISYYCDVSRELSTPGQVNVQFQATDIAAPGPNEVVVDLHAAALNFRDVLISINMLPELSYEGSYYGRHLGMEASGIVRAVGSEVKTLAVGDRVATAEACCFGNRLLAPAPRVTKLPENISLEVAAAVQSVYNTAHHALMNIARIKKGDRVLIHAAAGGVGHAAISICQHVGATVYATTSAEKQPTVRALGVKNIYDSRTTSWFADIRRDTNDEGMDVVLNSLAGKHQQLGVQILRPGGRFLEIGKLDIYDNNKIGLMTLRKNALFAAIDMDRLALDDPELTIETTKEVFHHMSQGHYHPIPMIVFPMNKMKDALELMKVGKHMGKVVLSNYVDGKPSPVRVRKPQRVFKPDATYIVTGGAGGFGSKIVRYAYDQGARHFLITVTKNPERVTNLFRDMTKDPTCTVEAVVADTSKEEDMVRLIALAKSQPYPLKGIFHAAGISIDNTLDVVKVEDFVEVGGPKAMGAWYLHQQTKDMDLDAFVVISSIASLFGGRGRSAYCGANSFLDALIRSRRLQGLPGTAFNMSSLSDVGILVTDVKVRKMQLMTHVEFVQSTRALKDLEDAVVCGFPLGTQIFFREQARSVYPNWASYLQGMTNTFTIGTDTTKGGQAMNLREVTTMLIELVKSIGGHDEVLAGAPLFSVGMDSFSTVELISQIKQQFGVEVSSSKLGPGTTVGELAKMVYTMQSGAAGGATADAVASEAAAPEKKKKSAGTMSRLYKASSNITAPRPFGRSMESSLSSTQLSNVPLSKSLPGPTASSLSLRPQSSEQPNPITPIDEESLATHHTKPDAQPIPCCVPLFQGKTIKQAADMQMDKETAKKWLVCPQRKPNAKKRIICYTWAGGTSKIYWQWFLPDVEVVAVCLPGRDTRIDEKPDSNICRIANHVAKALEVLDYLNDIPLAIFGFSYGSYVALETARVLKQQYNFSVDRLFVCSAITPHKRFFLWWYSMAPDIYVHMLLGFFGGLPAEYGSFLNSENRKAVAACKKDLGAMDFYTPKRDHCLTSPITVLHGAKDILSTTKYALHWRDYTSKDVTVHVLPKAQHIFILEKDIQPVLLEYINETLIG